MFNNKPDIKKGKPVETEINSHNLITNGTEIKGDITLDGNIRVDGTIIGNIISKGKVVIGETGKIEGEIECQTAVVSGEIKGKLIAYDLVSIKSKALIEGDIYYGKLEVDQGAKINGSLISNNINTVTNNKVTESLKTSEKNNSKKEFSQV